MKNLIYKLLVLLILATGTACTQEKLLDNPDKGTDTEYTDPNKRELVLTLQKELKVEGSPATRTIATDEENEIASLDIYLFASNSESGEYTFMKRYYYRSSEVMPKPADGEEVKLQMIAGQPSVTLHPEKGTYVKIYCVANQTDLYTKDGKGYKIYADFKEFKQSAPGSMDNVITPGVPTEKDFQKLVAKVIDPTDKKGYISPALVMSGADLTTVDLRDFSAASRLLRGIKLVRAVARFDILNDPEKTKFTLDSVTMLKGRPITTLFPIEAQKGEEDEGLINYPTYPVTGAHPTDKSYPIFYSYASTKEDKGELVLIGRYAINKTQEEKVRYKIPFLQKKENSQEDALYVEINPNHRYNIEVLEANQYELKFNFHVKDWEEGDDVDTYEPDNKIHMKLSAGNHASNFCQERKNRLLMYINPTNKEGSVITEITANWDYEIEDKIEYNGYEWLEMKTEDITPPATRAKYPETTGKTTKITLTNTYKPATEDGKRPIAYIKLKDKTTGQVSKIEVVAIPISPNTNFITPFIVGDYFITRFNSTSNSYPYSSAAANAIKAGTAWYLPSMSEVCELFGINKTGTITETVKATSNLENWTDLKKGIAGEFYYWTSTEVTTGRHMYLKFIPTTNTIYWAPGNDTSNFSIWSFMKYDENQP